MITIRTGSDPNKIKKIIKINEIIFPNVIIFPSDRGKKNLIPETNE